MLDGVLHGGEEVSWDDVAAAIDEGLAVLAPHAAPDDDGDGDDHDHDEHDSEHDHGEHAAHDDD